jgi:hypothetical protein
MPIDWAAYDLSAKKRLGESCIFILFASAI